MTDVHWRLSLAVWWLRQATSYFAGASEKQERRLAMLRTTLDTLRTQQVAEIAQRESDIVQRDREIVRLNHELTAQTAEVLRLEEMLARSLAHRTTQWMLSRKQTARQALAANFWRWIDFAQASAFHADGRPRRWLRALMPIERFGSIRHRVESKTKEHLDETVSSSATETGSAARSPLGASVEAPPLAKPVPHCLADMLAETDRYPCQDYRQRMRDLINGERLRNILHVAIVTPPQRRSVADMLVINLTSIGFGCQIVAPTTVDVSADLYLVIEPDALSPLPPADKRIIVLAEEGHRPDMVADATLVELARSLAIFDASVQNIHRLQERGIDSSQTFFVPSGALDDSPMGARHLLLRALHGCGILTYDAFERATRETRLDSERIVLCLPESLTRFEHAQSGTQHDAILFPGLRDIDGWKGTAFSYRYLAERALRQQRQRLIIWEDDAELGEDFKARLGDILAYLDASTEPWDIFSGLLTDLSEQSEVTSVDLYGNDGIVWLNSVIGMVFGIYNGTALKALAAYRIVGDDIMRHTIDRYLESWRPTCLTVFPPLVRHVSDFTSTLWIVQGTKFISNEVIDPMIRRSQQRFVSKIADFIK